MEDSLGGVPFVMGFEVTLLTVWVLPLFVIHGFVIPSSQRTVPTVFEKAWATARWGNFAWGRDVTVPFTGRALTALASRSEQDSGVMRRALQTWFLLPVLAGYGATVWVPAVFGAAWTVAENDPLWWALPTLFAIMNISMMFLAVGLRQRAWILRVPFENKLYRTIATHQKRLTKGINRGKSEGQLRDITRAGARDIEAALRLRFNVTDDSASHTLAKSEWEHAVRPVLEASAQRLLNPDASIDSATWFAQWTKAVAKTAQGTKRKLARASDETPLPADPPGYLRLLILGTIMFTGSTLGFITTELLPGFFTSLGGTDLSKIITTIGAAIALIGGVRKILLPYWRGETSVRRP